MAVFHGEGPHGVVLIVSIENTLRIHIPVDCLYGCMLGRWPKIKSCICLR
jgi:hypothetical protein